MHKLEKIILRTSCKSQRMNPLCPDGEIRSDKAITQRRATFSVSPFSSRPPGVREGSPHGELLSPESLSFSLSLTFSLFSHIHLATWAHLTAILKRTVVSRSSSFYQVAFSARPCGRSSVACAVAACCCVCKTSRRAAEH